MMPPMVSTGRKLAAAAVHLLTAGGAAAGALALVAVGNAQYKAALLWMAVAAAIDGVDGPLARRARVEQAWPAIDGALLDNLVDYLNYVIVPAFFIYRTALLPPGADLVATLAICVASALQFAQSDAKTPDHYFKGFPSLWNVVLFYLLLLGLPDWVNLSIVALLCGAVFLPVFYVYPNRTPQLRGLTLTLTGLWCASLAVLLAQYPQPAGWLVYLSLVYGVYYVGLSLALTVGRAQKAATPVNSRPTTSS